MGLLERARFLLEKGEPEDRLEVEILRLDLEAWRKDLVDEVSRLDDERGQREEEILLLERSIRSALQEEDEWTARRGIARKREVVALRGLLNARRLRLEERLEILESDLEALARFSARYAVLGAS